MFKAKSVFLVFLILFLSNLTVWAQPRQAAPAAHAAVEETEFSGQQNQKWAEVQKTLLELKIKVDIQRNLVADLLRAKKDNEGKIAQSEIDVLRKEHEKLQNLTKDYNQMLSDFQFRFPEKGLESGRKYIRIENQTLDGIENDKTTQGRLKKLTNKIKKQYQDDEVVQPVSSDKLNNKAEKVPEGSQLFNPKKVEEIDVTEKIILVK